MLVTAGTVLCGFGKGRFASGDPQDDHQILFKVESPDDKAIMDGVCKPVSEYLTSKRQASPDKPPLCYHTATWEPQSNSWTFQLVTWIELEHFYFQTICHFFCNHGSPNLSPCHSLLQAEDEKVTFVPNMEEAKDMQGSCGKACSTAIWASSVTAIAWHYRTTIQGIQPIRPIVMTTRSFELEPETILLLE